MARIYLSPPHASGRELELVTEAIESNWLAPLGPHVDAFERELAEAVDVEHAVALSSGTAALHLALVVLGIGAGDEVACSSLTFAASANAITYTGALPFFVDCDETWTIDPTLLDEALADRRRAGARVRAVLAVDLYGQCCDYDALHDVCERHDVTLLQDAAESLGATYRGRPAGGQGALAAFSFNGNKIITTSGGGMLVTDDPGIASAVRHLATQAREPVVHYEHNVVGYNYRLSNLLAAVGRGQLEGLSAKIERRSQVGDRYRSQLGDLPGWTFQPLDPRGVPNQWLTVAQIDPAEAAVDRTAVMEALGALGIESRPAWKPMHAQPVFADREAVLNGTSDEIFARGLCLPSGSSLTDAQQEEVIAAIRDVAREL